MTSIATCPVCCGEFPIYFACGRIEGRCPQCGYAYQDTKQEPYDEIEERRKERERYALADASRMTFTEFCEFYAPGEWPWFRVVVDGETLGSFLTLEEAIFGGCAMLPAHSVFQIYRLGILVKVVQIKPEMKAVKVHVEYAIPRHRHDEEGDWYSYDFATPTLDEAQKIISHHKAQHGMYFEAVIS